MSTIEDLGDLRGKRVLVRADFNVPLDGSTITDDGRIRAALPTITRLVGSGAVVILTAHLGRPKGQVDPAYSLAPVAHRLGELLDQDVTLAPDVVGQGAADAVAAAGPGEVVLLRTCASIPARPPRTKPNGRTWPRTWLPWPTSSFPTASGWSTASRRACTTSPRSCRARWVSWSDARSRP